MLQLVVDPYQSIGIGRYNIILDRYLNWGIGQTVRPTLTLPITLYSTCSPAIKVAIDEINQNSYLPYNHSLDYILAETYGEENESILQLASLWKQNVSAFIGPQETCLHEARLASSLNLPMISHFCTHPLPSNKVSQSKIK